MLTLVLGLVLFFAIHLVPMDRDIRAGLATRFGEGPYKLVFSAVSLIGLVLIVVGYAKLQAMPGKNPELWSPPYWMRHVTFSLMLIAIILLVAAYIPSRIRTAVGHPMLAAVKIWAFAHLLVNGDLGSIILFGSFLVYAVVDRISVKRRGALGPLGAAKPSSIVNDVLVVGIGLALYAFLLFWGHGALFGMPLIPV